MKRKPKRPGLDHRRMAHNEWVRIVESNLNETHELFPRSGRTRTMALDTIFNAVEADLEERRSTKGGITTADYDKKAAHLKKLHEQYK